MNKHTWIFLLAIAVFFTQTACNKAVYQVFEVKSSDSKLDASKMEYKGDALKVTYDFWSDGGIVSFRITNTTNKPIYVDWDRSHFILNGLSREYYGDVAQNVSATTVNTLTKGKGISSKFKFSSTVSQQFGRQTKRLVEIPAGASIMAADFSVSNNIVADCDLKIPVLKKTATKDYTADNSPLIFRNYITYYTSRSEIEGDGEVLDNIFYVANITSMKMKEFTGPLQTAKESCTICPGAKKTKLVSYTYPYRSVNKFFASCGALIKK